MARRLEGRTFFTTYNNGVTALTSEDTMRNRQRAYIIQEALRENQHRVKRVEGWVVPDNFLAAAREGLLHIPGTPIFTFADAERVSTQPWFTGNMGHLEQVIEYVRSEGGKVEKYGFTVPFSNAAELGVHGLEAMRAELSFVTSDGQFRDNFGISLHEIGQWFAKNRQT